ncbi:MAG: SUMF1/EgtB/PvdO family nonheme iron enzyme [Spirosomataceae bacterium]
MRPALLVITLLLFFKYVHAQDKTLGTTQLPAGTEKRAAVIFANQNYDDPRYDLQKTHNDADDMKDVLEDMGFKVIVFEKDLNRTAFYRAINALRDKLKGYQMVFFYYSGHGSEYEGLNYLIPTDIKLEYDSDIKANGVEMDLVYKVLRQAQVKTGIVALDACRSLPVGKGEVATGLNIPRNNPSGTFTMYATEAGRVAKENRSPNGRNSFFTQELLKHLPIPNLTINEIHYNTRNAVGDATNQEQLPDVADKLGGKLYLLTKEVIDPEKEAMRAEIERLKAEQKNTTPADNTRVTPPTAIVSNSTTKAAKFLDLPFADMAYIEGGTFQMGDTGNEGENDEKPVHTVTVSSFWMSKYEVTQRQWTQIMGNNPSYFKNCDDCPVENVSWNDTQEFLKKLNARTGGNYRLPTEAEWEYAAGGGATTRARFGNSKDILAPKEANFDATAGSKKEYSVVGEYRSKTLRVGSFEPNTLGLYDMSGNVWEWCADWFGTYPSSSQANPKGPGSGPYRVLRGGSWNSAPLNARVANRHSGTPGPRGGRVGFRVVSPSQ